MIATAAHWLGWRAGAALVLAAAMVAGYALLRHWHMEQGRAEVHAEWNAERLATAKATLRILENHTRATQELQRRADMGRRALRDEIRLIDDDRADLVRRLQLRPQRPADGHGELPAAAGDGGTAVGATGAQLFREDGEFLAGEAARGDKLRAALRACYAEYRAARAAVNAVGE